VPATGVTGTTPATGTPGTPLVPPPLQPATVVHTPGTIPMGVVARAVPSTRQPDMGRTFISGLSGDVPFTRNADKSWSRGWIIATAEPTEKGVRLVVESGHHKANDPLTLFLQCRVRATVPDPSNPAKTVTEEKVVDLEVLHKGILNTNGFDNVATFEVDYKALNDQLQRIAPGAKLTIDANTPLAVYSRWDIGHQWGGYDRAGVFYLPWKAAPAAGATTGAATTDGITGDMPLDIGVTLQDDLVGKYTRYDNSTGTSSPVLLKGGQFMSRVESEVKVAVPWNKGEAVAKEVFELIKLTNDPVKAQKRAKELFGAGWTVNIDDVKRFYNKDAQGDFILDDKGLPQVNPMLDRYYDSQNGQLAEKGIALRFRETPKDPDGLVNIKLPSPANLPNPTGLTGLIGRYDTGIQTVKGLRSNPQALAQFFDSNENLNAFRHVKAMVPNLRAADVLAPAMDLSTKRYKVILHHENGTSIELSLDHVNAVALDAHGKTRMGADGKPMVATFWQLELDLEHLQTSSTNVQVASGGSSLALNKFSRPADQEAWLAKLGASATLSGPARVHKPDDVTNRSIVESDAYKLLQEVGPKLHKWLLAEGAQPATQKYAMAARMVGIVPMTPEQAALFARESEVSAKYKDQFATTYKGVEDQIVALLADAKTKGTTVTLASDKLRQPVNARWQQFSALTQQVNMHFNARTQPEPAKTNAKVKFDAELATFAAGLQPVLAGLKDYDTAINGLGVNVADEQKAIDQAEASVASYLAAHTARLAAHEQAGLEADPTKKAQLMTEAYAADTAFNAAYTAASNQMRALTSLSTTGAKLAQLVTLAESQATLLRSDAVWGSLKATPA